MGFRFFLRIRAASTPHACLEGYIRYFNGNDKIIEERLGDLARTQQTFLIPLNGTVDQKVLQACDDPEACSHFNQPIPTYPRIEVFEMIEKHSGIELAIF
jgi:hypothetical protein